MVQRLYDPGEVKDGTRGAGLDYLLDNGPGIVGAYIAALNPTGSRAKEAQKRVFRATCLEVAARFGPTDVSSYVDRLTDAVFEPDQTEQTWLLNATNAPAKVNTIKLGVRTLNSLEHEVQTLGAADLSQDSSGRVNVGTEFTFTSPSLKSVKVPGNVGAGKTVLDNWKDKVKKATSPQVPKPAIDEADGKVGKKKAWKFTYTQQQRTWWWALDVDDECVETQTAPVPSDVLLGGWVKGIMDAHIFGIAKNELNLTVDSSKYGGGGHISLDSATLFGGSVDLLLEVLTAIQESCAKWKEQFEYEDEPNSPWLKEQGYGADPTVGAALTAFKDTVTGIEGRLRKGAPVSFDAITTELEQFHRSILNLWAREKEQTGSKREKEAAANILTPQNRPHYQAVNVEHLVPAKGSGRRLELRAIGAQKDTDDLREDLTYIMNIIDSAKAAARNKAMERGVERGVWA